MQAACWTVPHYRFDGHLTHKPWIDFFFIDTEKFMVLNGKVPFTKHMSLDEVL